MKILACLLLAGTLCAQAQVAASPGPSVRELYRIHFFKAAAGKLPDLLDAYMSLPAAPPGHESLIFRHLAGDDWDLLVIYPQGPKATLDANPQYTEAQHKLRDRVMGDYIWHSDTYAMGPPLDDVKKALAVSQGAKEGGVYTVEDYTALNGHLRQLDDVLTRDMAAAAAPGAVKFEHLQGAGWDFLVLFRYASWQEYAAAETDPAADDRARKQGFKSSSEVGFALRDHMAAHHDTFVHRIE